jgi:hypothetical protein
MRRLVLVGLVAIAAGCSTSNSAEVDSNQTEQTGEEASADTKAEKSGPSQLPDFAPQDDTAPIKSLGWGEDGSLRLGFADGKWARVELASRETSLAPAISAEASVLALSPHAKLAFVASDPPVVVRLRDHQAVMRLTNVDALETAGFFTSGKGLFVVEPSGKLHVWGQSEQKLDEVSLKDLKRFMARQSPDFTANLSSLRGQVLVTDANNLIMGTDTGKVLRWKPDNPGEVDVIVKLPTAARSFGFDGRFVAATAADGSLRAISLFERTFLPWSKDATGELAAASAKRQDKFAVADQGTLGMRAFKDGAYDWQAELPTGDLCGLTFSPDADTLVVCVDSGVVLVEPETGKSVAAFRRSGDVIEWRE